MNRWLSDNIEQRAAWWLIWVSLCASLVIYGAMAALLAGADTPDPIPPGWLAAMLLAAGVCLGLALGLVPRLARSLRRFWLYCVLRWALVEVVGVIGTLAFFLTSQWEPFIGLLGVSLLTLLALAPTRGAQARFEHAREIIR